MADELMTFKEVMKLLRKSRGTIDRLRKAGKLTDVRFDPGNKRTRLCFYTSEVRALLPPALRPGPEAIKSPIGRLYSADAEAVIPVRVEHEYPPPRDESLPAWAHAARLAFIDGRIADALAHECSSREIRQAIVEIRKALPDADVTLLVNVLVARDNGLLPEPALPRRRR